LDHGSIPAANAINHLVQELSKLPGIGPKSAQRITYHLLRSTPEQTGLLSDAVEQPQDILAIEHTGIYRGLYHVLHGAISPTEGVGAGDVRIRELTDRLQDGTVQEIILATNTNLEGEQTALYLNHILAPLGVRVTRLAHGLPFGTELEYADDTTLTRAIEGRQAL